MTTIQDPITLSVAKAIGMTVEECEENPKRAARKAAAVLKANGYERRYCTSAWDRGMRWYRKGSDIPERDMCSTTMLGVAMIEGNVAV